MELSGHCQFFTCSQDLTKLEPPSLFVCSCLVSPPICSLLSHPSSLCAFVSSSHFPFSIFHKAPPDPCIASDSTTLSVCRDAHYFHEHNINTIYFHEHNLNTLFPWTQSNSNRKNAVFKTDGWDWDGMVNRAGVSIQNLTVVQGDPKQL